MSSVEEQENQEQRTLWVGDVESWWDEQYASSLFSCYDGFQLVKLMRNKRSGQLQGYGFVVFDSREKAQNCLEQLNGQSMPNSARKYRLNWASMSGRKRQTDISGGCDEWSLFVGDLSSEVNDYALQQFFSDRYPQSIRGARVVMDPQTGNSRGYGFVRFSEEGAYNRALEEMNGMRLKNRAIRVSSAQPRRDGGGQNGRQYQNNRNRGGQQGQQGHHHHAQGQAPQGQQLGQAPGQAPGQQPGQAPPMMPGMMPGMMMPGMDASGQFAFQGGQYPFMYPNLFFPPTGADPSSGFAGLPQGMGGDLTQQQQMQMFQQQHDQQALLMQQQQPPPQQSQQQAQQK